MKPPGGPTLEQPSQFCEFHFHEPLQALSMKLQEKLPDSSRTGSYHFEIYKEGLVLLNKDLPPRKSSLSEPNQRGGREIPNSKSL